MAGPPPPQATLKTSTEKIITFHAYPEQINGRWELAKEQACKDLHDLYKDDPEGAHEALAFARTVFRKKGDERTKEDILSGGLSGHELRRIPYSLDVWKSALKLMIHENKSDGLERLHRLMELQDPAAMRDIRIRHWQLQIALELMPMVDTEQFVPFYCELSREPRIPGSVVEPWDRSIGGVTVWHHLDLYGASLETRRIKVTEVVVMVGVYVGSWKSANNLRNKDIPEHLWAVLPGEVRDMTNCLNVKGRFHSANPASGPSSVAPSKQPGRLERLQGNRSPSVLSSEQETAGQHGRTSAEPDKYNIKRLRVEQERLEPLIAQYMAGDHVTNIDRLEPKDKKILEDRLANDGRFLTGFINHGLRLWDDGTNVEIPPLPPMNTARAFASFLSPKGNLGYWQILYDWLCRQILCDENFQELWIPWHRISEFPEDLRMQAKKKFYWRGDTPSSTGSARQQQGGAGGSPATRQSSPKASEWRPGEKRPYRSSSSGSSRSPPNEGPGEARAPAEPTSYKPKTKKASTGGSQGEPAMVTGSLMMVGGPQQTFTLSQDVAAPTGPTTGDAWMGREGSGEAGSRRPSREDSPSGTSIENLQIASGTTAARPSGQRGTQVARQQASNPSSDSGSSRSSDQSSNNSNNRSTSNNPSTSDNRSSSKKSGSSKKSSSSSKSGNSKKSSSSDSPSSSSNSNPSNPSQRSRGSRS